MLTAHASHAYDSDHHDGQADELCECEYSEEAVVLGPQELDQEALDSRERQPKHEEPSGGTTVAVTRKLIEQGRIGRDESVVIAITGNGLKTQEVVVDQLEPGATIDAKLSAFDKIVDKPTVRGKRVVNVS